MADPITDSSVLETPTILIVDDSSVVRKSLTKTLKEAGYKTEAASSGKEALKKVRDLPDLILLDVHMPKMSGYDVLRKIKSDTSTKSIPVIMLTAMAEIENRIEAFSEGADDYLLKPYYNKELLTRIEHLLKAKVLYAELRRSNEKTGKYLAQLQELREFNERIIEQMGSGLVLMDLDGGILKINQAALDILRIPLESEVLGCPVTNINPILKAFFQADHASLAREMEFPLTKKFSVPIMFSSTYLLDHDGEKQGIITIFRDLTERKRAEEVLRKEQAETSHFKTLLENVMNNMMTGLMVTDNDGKVIIINQSAQKLFDTCENDIVGKPVEVLSPDLGIFKELILPAGMAQEVSIELVNGKEIPLGFSSTHLLDRQGSKNGTITVFKDLTEIKEIGKELKEKEKFATIGQIAGGIAHEIKNPIFAISSGVQVLEAELELNEEQRDTLKIIFQETMRVNRLIKQLLFYGARQELNRIPLNIQALVKEVIALNQGLLRSKSIKVKKEFSDDMPPLIADRDKIIQVLINIVQNAIDASEESGAIDIVCGIDKNTDSVIIRIKDRGPGIPEEYANRIFDIFFSTKKGNAGMGLAISKKIVTDHGGDIGIETRKGGGTVFSIELPLREIND